MFQWKVSRKSQECIKKVSRVHKVSNVFQGRFKIQGCSEIGFRVLLGSFKGASRKFQGGFKED